MNLDDYHDRLLTKDLQEKIRETLLSVPLEEWETVKDAMARDLAGLLRGTPGVPDEMIDPLAKGIIEAGARQIHTN